MQSPLLVLAIVGICALSHAEGPRLSLRSRSSELQGFVGEDRQEAVRVWGFQK